MDQTLRGVADTLKGLPMPELRKDPIVGRWVIIATERAKRPVIPKTELPPPAAKKEAEPTPVQACLLYQSEITRLCASLLGGTLDRASCYAEILRMSGKAAIEIVSSPAPPLTVSDPSGLENVVASNVPLPLRIREIKLLVVPSSSSTT